MKWNETTQVLKTCEQGLRRLVAEAAGQGDYASVGRITALAKAVAALATEDATPPSDLPQDSRTETTVSNEKKGTARVLIPSSAVSVGRKTHPATAVYPKFFRRGNELVKVGWSKRDRKEYNHRAPRRTVDAASAAVRRVGAKGQMFNGNQLLPLKDPSGGTTLPDYQSYVALAWFKHLGIVEQRGRRMGYTLAPDKQIDRVVTAAWPELAEWRG